MTRKKRLLSFLQNHSVAVMASLNADRVPEVVAIYFYVDTDFALYFVTKLKTRKIKNIMRNSSVTLLIYDVSDMTSSEIRGKAEIVNDTVDFAQIIEKFENVFKLQKTLNGLPPISQIEAGDYVACKVIPHHIYFRRFGLTPEQAPVSEEFFFV